MRVSEVLEQLETTKHLFGGQYHVVVRRGEEAAVVRAVSMATVPNSEVGGICIVLHVDDDALDITEEREEAIREEAFEVGYKEGENDKNAEIEDLRKELASARELHSELQSDLDDALDQLNEVRRGR